MKIYFQGGEKAKDLTNLLLSGFSYKWEYGYWKFVETFKNKECSLQEFKPARRSFSDLLLIARTYFPKTTKGQLAFILLNKIPNMFAFRCEGTGLNVFMINTFNHREVICINSDRTKKDRKGVSFSMVERNSNAYKKKYVQNTN